MDFPTAFSTSVNSWDNSWCQTYTNTLMGDSKPFVAMLQMNSPNTSFWRAYEVAYRTANGLPDNNDTAVYNEWADTLPDWNATWVPVSLWAPLLQAATRMCQTLHAGSRKAQKPWRNYGYVQVLNEPGNVRDASLDPELPYGYVWPECLDFLDYVTLDKRWARQAKLVAPQIEHQDLSKWTSHMTYLQGSYLSKFDYRSTALYEAWVDGDTISTWKARALATWDTMYALWQEEWSDFSDMPIIITECGGSDIDDDREQALTELRTALLQKENVSLVIPFTSLHDGSTGETFGCLDWTTGAPL